ncbi:MAG TPA: hypothetical protein VFC02_21235 [Anaerolineales bacterium]|nr:hypothetical protein [Anaerolineales bacterium]
MNKSLLEQLKSIDPAILTEIVQQDQNDASFQITNWIVRRLSDKGIANPDGLWLFSGQGTGARGIRPWSVVLKILSRQKDELPLQHLWHWKREFSLAQSGLTANLPVKAPRFYGWEEMPEGARIWMEHVEDSHPRKWTLDEYAFAAYQLGKWNSTYLTGTPLPNEAWLTRQHYRSWLAGLNTEEAWEFSLNRKHISKEARTRHTVLWDKRETFFSVLENLPQVFSHFDSQRRNLLIRKGKYQHNELIAIDWQQCGIGAIGTELNWLIGLSSLLLEWAPSKVITLDKAAFQGYVQGLQEGGWFGNIESVRLGYVAMLAVFVGCAFPSVATFWCSPENQGFTSQIFGIAGEEFFLETLPVLHYELDCGDEAQILMKKLGFS